MLKDDYDINIIGRQAYEEETGEITLNTTGPIPSGAGPGSSPIRSTTRMTPRSATPLF